jgi:hypothetical protein
VCFSGLTFTFFSEPAHQCGIPGTVTAGIEIDADDVHCPRYECSQCGVYSVHPDFKELWDQGVEEASRRRVIAMLKAAKKRSKGGDDTVQLVKKHLEWQAPRRKSLLHAL